MARGKFITLEGGEGCGKTTQAAKLRQHLEALGREIVAVREPGGTPLGEKARTLIKDFTQDPPCDRAELLLFLAARAQLVRNVILPALERGAWVVSDRFSDSTFAYQGAGRGLDAAFLAAACDFACAGLKPNLTLLLDAPPETTFARLAKRQAAEGSGPDRIERESLAFHERLRRAFLDMAAAEPDRFAVIDASGSPEETWSGICRSLKRLD